MKNHLPTHWQFDSERLNVAVKTDSHTDKTNKWLIPPLVDLCAVIADGEHASIVSESAAARANGFLYVCTPPTAERALDSVLAVDELCQKGLQQGICLKAIGALTQGLGGQKLANIASLAPKTVAVSNARYGFDNDDVLLRALEYASTFGAVVFFYPDEPSLSKNGVAHDGYVASYHGLAGIPWIAETVALAKQLLIVEETGVSAHFSQISCRTSVELIATAKKKGLPITCDVAMHQLHLTDDAIEGYNTLAYVIPPLRSNTDQQALIKGLQNGTIDAISSHHIPVAKTHKLAPFAESMAGISAFDTFMALAIKLVDDGILTLDELIAKISLNPAKIIGVDDDEHYLSSAVVVNPTIRWQVGDDTMYSQGKNTPFIGQTLTGKVEQVFFG